MASPPEQAQSLAQQVDQTTAQPEPTPSASEQAQTEQDVSSSISSPLDSEEKPSAQPNTAASEPPKPIHALVVDTGPIIKNDPPVSTLLGQAVELWTLPSVITEIRDAATRSRVETTLLPFLKLRNPKPESVKFVQDFARRTGDLEVLSRPDIHLIALTYELECERNGGDWRLRRTPGQKGMNGKPPGKEEGANAAAPAAGEAAAEQVETNEKEAEGGEVKSEQAGQQVPPLAQEAVTYQLDSLTLEPRGGVSASESQAAEQPETTASTAETTQSADAQAEVVEEDDDDDDEDGWITPSNLKQQQQKDRAAAPEQPIQKLLQAALLTSDYAMQNVSLRMNLNLVSPAFARITRVKTWVLRCHGCFQITREMSKQFCPRCGQPTLTRVSCSTDAGGNFTVHLKKNYQWNNRGNVYSIPKPVHGSANGKMRGPGGGKQGWGRELLLAEDQKEYVQKSTEQQRQRVKDLMDDDFLPSILTGDRRGREPGRAR
ncbi:Nin one binding Zn-ribbon like-domain-containing protein [Microdochium trichocladiopsis]|uniref:20S-pre-rRNA D-site endonuclease NOB1 n=1 Tax=Microdochium trichocladiopsis TaxID=1682393 RepID=A0A9P8YA74_9PEZI|nr:Nin one binding Zn-ribbon like-domain-containing protein [Microdochium trichocladiopsis]KAH7033605.1 Nin one binding Zn-ribbon like-domain-containing protein [Microdochium trichocladiopsis]